MNSFGYFIKLCGSCIKVIAQCKCMNCNRKIEYGICDGCWKIKIEEDKIENE